MICTSKNIKNIVEKYCFFYDSNILTFNILFVDSIRNISIHVRCRNIDNESVVVEFFLKNVAAWMFSCTEEKIAPEIVSEGFRFMYNDKWMIDFGDDPDLLISDVNWISLSNKFIIARELSISEISKTLLTKL